MSFILYLHDAVRELNFWERIVLKVTVEYVKVCVHDVITYACLLMCSFLRGICASVLVRLDFVR